MPVSLRKPAVADTLLVLTNLPDAAAAQTLARRLVEDGLVACANVLAPCTSIYRWQGRLEEATETPLLLKLAATAYPAVEAAIRAAHPYELPEIVAVPVEQGLPAYLAWVGANSRTPGPIPPTSK